MLFKFYIKRGWNRHRGITLVEGFLDAKSAHAAKSAAVAIFLERGEGFNSDHIMLIRRDGERPIERWEGFPDRDGSASWKMSTPETWKPRGICPECGGEHAVTTRGTMAPHRRSDGRTVRTLQGNCVPAQCDGAAQLPSRLLNAASHSETA